MDKTQLEDDLGISLDAPATPESILHAIHKVTQH